MDNHQSPNVGTNDIETKPASELAKVGELPRPTLTTHNSHISTTETEKDAAGVAFDPAIHERRKRQNGQWMKKRGNGARKLAGKNYVVPGFEPKQLDSQPQPGANDKQLDSQPQPGTAAPQSFASGSFVASDNETTTDETIHEPEIERFNSVEDYAPTGEALTRGLFGAAQLSLDGKAWEATPDERKAFAGAFARVFHHYQLPRLGPLVELLLLFPPTIAKRADEPRTKKLLSWLSLIFKRKNNNEPPKEQVPVPDAPPPAQRGVVTNPVTTNPLRRGG